jgi:ElaB/YqjD/DUF883 family membrane-anchored ribosome-binding protein
MSADKDGVSGTSHDNLAKDVSSLRQDMAKMQEILSRFTSEAGGQAARTVRNVGHTVASQVGSMASGLASTGSQQLKTFTNEFEDITRKNPLGALAGALVLGIVIGLIVRRR